MVGEFRTGLQNIGFVLQALGGQDPSSDIQARTDRQEKQRLEKQRQEQQARQQQAQAQLPSILSGTNIPAFLKRELGSPQAIEAERIRNLQSALGVLAPEQLIKQATAQAFPQPEAPVTLRPGEQLVSPRTGEVVTRAPQTQVQAAQARKFNLEADKLKKQLEGGLTALDPQVFKNTSQLRKEFTGLSKDFITQRDAFARVQASAEDPSAAGDIALIFNFMKTLDPGSTVREGEFATAANAAGISDRLRARVNRVIAGERLAPNTRADFVKRAGKIFKTAEAQHDKRVGTFSSLALRSGLPAEQVVLDLGLAQQQVPQVPQVQEVQKSGRLKFNPATGNVE